METREWLDERLDAFCERCGNASTGIACCWASRCNPNGGEGTIVEWSGWCSAAGVWRGVILALQYLLCMAWQVLKFWLDSLYLEHGDGVYDSTMVLRHYIR
jgi:hypothetical protein